MTATILKFNRSPFPCGATPPAAWFEPPDDPEERFLDEVEAECALIMRNPREWFIAAEDAGLSLELFKLLVPLAATLQTRPPGIDDRWQALARALINDTHSAVWEHAKRNVSRRGEP